VPSGSPANHFLSSLSADDTAALRPHLGHIALSRGSVANRVGEPIPRVIFPYSGAVSLVLQLANGQGIEVGIIGRNGLIGGSAALGQPTAFNQAVVQVDLSGAAIGAPILGDIAKKRPTLLTALIRWDQALLAQAQQVAACNVVHGLEQRLCRWLAYARDLIRSDTLPLTQDSLAQMLGVRRSSLTLAAQRLQEMGTIDYRRGVIHIRDVEQLQHAACECYQTTNERLNQLIGWQPAFAAPDTARRADH
jgi:CRP-like cAMP-binding protein